MKERGFEEELSRITTCPLEKKDIFGIIELT
jgi:hypothetical protein